ncbi:MAG: hypothetical protein ACT4OM_13985 [Actinomycetota bacterium]
MLDDVDALAQSTTRGQIVLVDRGRFGPHYPNRIAVARFLTVAVAAIEGLRSDLV